MFNSIEEIPEYRFLDTLKNDLEEDDDWDEEDEDEEDDDTSDADEEL